MIIVSFKGYLRARQSEWIVSAMITLLGVVLLHPAETFNGTSFTWFAESGIPENAWGAIFLVIGGFRLLGLFVNGRKASVTSWMRFVSSFCGFILFMVASIGFVASGVVSTAWAIYPPLALSELINIYFTMIDAGAAWRKGQVSRATNRT